MAREAADPISDDVWALQDAKARLSELVERSLRTGRPQRITRRGEDAVVVLTVQAYRRLVRGRRGSLVEFLRRGGPLPDDVVDQICDRSRDTGRTIVMA